MADRPIIFSAPMVRAILREIDQLGTGKTQTRRIVRPQPFASGYYDGKIDMVEIPADSRGQKAFRFNASAVGGGAVLEEVFEPRINEGDRLYVREHWRTTHVLDGVAPRDLRKSENEVVDYTPIFFIADEATQSFNPLIDPPFGKHRQAMHMPRWASRLTLVVDGVKVERLQDISEAEAIAEGVEVYDGIDPDCSGYLNYRNNSEDGYWIPAKASYASLWNAINGPGSWDANPWVVAYTFRPILGNIDHVGGDT